MKDALLSKGNTKKLLVYSFNIKYVKLKYLNM